MFTAPSLPHNGSTACVTASPSSTCVRRARQSQLRVAVTSADAAVRAEAACLLARMPMRACEKLLAAHSFEEHAEGTRRCSSCGSRERPTRRRRRTRATTRSTTRCSTMRAFAHLADGAPTRSEPEEKEGGGSSHRRRDLVDDDHRRGARPSQLLRGGVRDGRPSDVLGRAAGLTVAQAARCPAAVAAGLAQEKEASPTRWRSAAPDSTAR